MQNMLHHKSLTLLCAASAASILVSFLLLGSFGRWPDHIDNWNLWELSLNLTRDFYHVWNLRSYATEPGQSVAYPPLYPLLIALVDGLTGAGPASGTIVNYCCAVAFVTVNARIARKIVGFSAVGFVVAAATLCFLPFTAELANARSHPLALLILAVIALIILRHPLQPWTSALVGLLAGLGVMARYDFLLPSIVLGLLVWFWSRRITTVFAYGTGALAGASPWIAFSWLTFGTPFASDSRWTGAAREPGLWPNDWIAPPGPTPLAGITDVLRKLSLSINVPIEVAGDYTRHILPTAAVLLGALAGAAIFARLRPSTLAFPVDLPQPKQLQAFRRLIELLLLWPPLVFSLWLAGYPSVRYLSGLHWNILAILILGFSIRFRRDDPVGFRNFVAMSAIGFAVLGAGLALYFRATARLDPPALVQDRVKTMATCLSAAGASPGERILFGDSEVQAAQFGPLARWASASPPRNGATLSTSDWAAFITFGQIRYVAVRLQPTHALKPLLDVAAVPGCPLDVYRVIVGDSAGLPPELAAQMAAALRTAQADPAVRAAYVQAGADHASDTPAEFDAFFTSERARWAEVVRLTGATLE